MNMNREFPKPVCSECGAVLPEHFLTCSHSGVEFKKNEIIKESKAEKTEAKICPNCESPLTKSATGLFVGHSFYCSDYNKESEEAAAAETAIKIEEEKKKKESEQKEKKEKIILSRDAAALIVNLEYDINRLIDDFRINSFKNLKPNEAGRLIKFAVDKIEEEMKIFKNVDRNERIEVFNQLENILIGPAKELLQEIRKRLIGTW